MEERNLVEHLAAFGLTGQEAQVYLELFRSGTSNGYEIAKCIGISRANVYKALEGLADKGGAYVTFPYDIRKEFGRGRVKVHATFDGEPYDGSIVNMGVKHEDGSICYIIGIKKEIRTRIKKQPGDTVKVTVRERE